MLLLKYHLQWHYKKGGLKVTCMHFAGFTRTIFFFKVVFFFFSVAMQRASVVRAFLDVDRKSCPEQLSPVSH